MARYHEVEMVELEQWLRLEALRLAVESIGATGGEGDAARYRDRARLFLEWLKPEPVDAEEGVVDTGEWVRVDALRDTYDKWRAATQGQMGSASLWAALSEVWEQ